MLDPEDLDAMASAHKMLTNGETHWNVTKQVLQGYRTALCHNCTQTFIVWCLLLSLIVCSCPSPSYYAPARSQCNLAITSHFRCPCSDYSLISFKHLDYCPWRVNPSPRMFFPVNKELCSNGPQLTLESVCTTHHLGWHPPVLQAMSKTAPRLFFNPCFLGPNLAPLC